MPATTRALIIDGARVRAAREGRGLNQTELARLCGISQAALSNIERGQRNASPPLMRSLARHLGRGIDAITRAAA